MAKFDVVFEGGGAKGVAFAGALGALLEQGHELGRLIGTSAGAIAAALCAAGYDPGEMVEAIGERVNGKPRFSTFMDIPSVDGFSADMREQSVTMEMLRSVDLPVVPATLEERVDRSILNALLDNRRFLRLFSFVERGGLYAGDAFREWIEEKLQAKGASAGESLADFHRRTGYDVSLVVSDTTDKEMLVLNHRTAPGVPVAMAVRMSMSIPFVWQEVVWQKEWGGYLGREKPGNLIVDGGMLSNFPISLLTTRDAAVVDVMGNGNRASSTTLGLLIDESLPVPGTVERGCEAGGFSGFPVVRRVMRMLDTMMKASDNAVMLRFESVICRLPAAGYGTLEFDLGGRRLDNLLNAARSAMEIHLCGRGFQLPIAA